SRSSCRSQASASADRSASSSSRISPVERSSGASICAASSPRPRSSATPARDKSACREDIEAVYRSWSFVLGPRSEPNLLAAGGEAVAPETNDERFALFCQPSLEARGAEQGEPFVVRLRRDCF